jgi:hypothetical protein
VTYIEVLQDKRRQVVADIERLRADAAGIAAVLSTRENQLRNIDDLLAMEDGTAEPKRVRPVPAASQTRSTRFVDAACELLKRDGKPTHYRALAQNLADEGVYVPGQDPAANLLAHMSRDPRFGRAGRRGMYGLVEWPDIKAAAAGRRPPASRRSSRPAGRGAASHA